MNRITFPLPSELPDASYSDLHDALRYLLANDLLPLSLAEREALFPQLKDDRTADNYGNATHSLVAVFQQSVQLQQTRHVHQRTAKLMNSRLASASRLLQGIALDALATIADLARTPPCFTATQETR